MRPQRRANCTGTVLDLAKEALQEIWDVCSHEHWQKVGAALEEIGEVRKAKFGVDAHESV